MTRTIALKPRIEPAKFKANAAGLLPRPPPHVSSILTFESNHNHRTTDKQPIRYRTDVSIIDSLTLSSKKSFASFGLVGIVLY